MKSHIAIIAKGRELCLPEDFSIDIDDQNPMFNENEMFSYPVEMPLDGNRFLLGAIDDPLNVDRPVGLEHTPMRIIVDGMPFRSGELVTAEDEEIDGALTMNVAASGNSLAELVSNLTCRDIPVKDKIKIGEKIGNVSVQTQIAFTARMHYHEGHASDSYTLDAWTKGTFTSDIINFTPQALGFSYPAACVTSGSKETALKETEKSYANGNVVLKPKVTESFINVDKPYPFPYCNARVAYKHYGLSEDNSGETSSGLADPKIKWGENSHYPYWVLEADRPQSGICFYILYFLDCLFDFLGYQFDNSELLKVEDMKRLCFFTTHCKFDEEVKTAGILASEEDINQWLDSRGCGGSIEFNLGEVRDIQEVEFNSNNGYHVHWKVGEHCDWIKIDPELVYKNISADIMNMYANSDNFPDASVQTVLDSLYNSFGIRFDVDDEKKFVKAYFLRDVFRNQDDPLDFNGRVISINKVAEKITGFRMKYGEESSAKDQRDNIRYKKKDYNTDYDYIDYPQKSTVTDQTYEQIFRLPKMLNAAGNMNVYIDIATGNAYRIKIASDAKSFEEMKPALFEVGGFKGIELGDCSEINEEFVIEMSSDFVPMSFNDVNYNYESSLASGTYTDEKGQVFKVNTDKKYLTPILSAFIDEDMEHEFLEKRIQQSLGSSILGSSMDMVLRLVESYDPSGTEDGNSPLQSYDWGLAIAIMRGGGTDASVETYDYDYDGFGNSKWRTVHGDYALTSDSIDMFGNDFDYNGVLPGINYSSGEERFSLKICAWKQPPWADEPLIAPDIRDGNGNIETKIKSRGLFHTFISEFANFILKRRKYRIRMECSAAQLADIPNNWNRRYRINGLVGFINKLSYSISAKEGVRDLEIEFYVL